MSPHARAREATLFYAELARPHTPRGDRVQAPRLIRDLPTLAVLAVSYRQNKYLNLSQELRRTVGQMVAGVRDA